MTEMVLADRRESLPARGTRRARAQARRARGEQAEAVAEGGGDHAGGDVEHVVVARGDDGERDRRAPEVARAPSRAGWRWRAATAMPIAKAKPTCRLGTAASSL